MITTAISMRCSKLAEEGGGGLILCELRQQQGCSLGGVFRIRYYGLGFRVLFCFLRAHGRLNSGLKQPGRHRCLKGVRSRIRYQRRRDRSDHISERSPEISHHDQTRQLGSPQRLCPISHRDDDWADDGRVLGLGFRVWGYLEDYETQQLSEVHITL